MAKSKRVARPRGRPRRADAPDLNATELDKILVRGESIDANGQPIAGVRFPSYRELGERFGVSHTVITRFSRDNNCLERRKGENQARIAERIDSMLRERPSHLTLEVVSELRELALSLLRDSMNDGRYKPDIADVERFWRVEKDMLATLHAHRAGLPDGVPSLEELQQAYEEREAEYARTTPGMRGEVDPFAQLEASIDA